MAKSLTQRTLKGVAWVGGVAVVRLGLRVISVAILARLLTPQEYGIVAGALVAMELASMLYSLGLAPTLIQRKEVRRDHIATAFLASLIMAMFTGAWLSLSAPLAADIMHIPELTDVLRVLAFLTPFGAFGALCEALLAKNMQQKAIALRPLFTFLISAFAVAIPLAYAGYSYWALVAMQMVEIVGGAMLLGWSARQLLVFPRFSRKAFKELWPLSLGFSLNQPLIYVAANVDKFLIARFMGAEALGLYSRASFLTTNTRDFFNHVARLTLFPAIAQIQDEQERMRRSLLHSLSLASLFMLPASAFSIVFAREIIDLLLGAQWNAAVVPFAILSAVLYFQMGHKICGTVLQGLGRPYTLMIIQTIAATLTAVGVLVVGQYGLTAICLSVVLARIATAVATFSLACNAVRLNMAELVRIHTVPVAMTVIVVVAGMLVKRTLGDASAITTLFSATLISGIFVGGALFVCRKTHERWGTAYIHTLTAIAPLRSRK